MMLKENFSAQNFAFDSRRISFILARLSETPSSVQKFLTSLWNPSKDVKRGPWGVANLVKKIWS